ncbi:MAG: SDR family oxidoreductase [Lentisphaeraceae bacterium]|nr:SDR family oxidoreductase [Lentisphaeraceae bacterium]
MKKNVVLTGANRGIGLALVQQYLADDYQVWATCRQTSSELTQTQARVIEDIDLSTVDFPKKLQAALKGVQIDLLINNAGIFQNEMLGNIDYEALQKQFTVNAIAPLKVTEALLPQLNTNAKIALITSRMGSIGDNTSGGYYGYRMSKTALNSAGQSLAQDLKEQGISLAILHPGFVQTDMVGHQGDISTETAATRLKQVIENLSLENTGTFWHSNGSELPW